MTSTDTEVLLGQAQNEIKILVDLVQDLYQRNSKLHRLLSESVSVLRVIMAGGSRGNWDAYDRGLKLIREVKADGDITT